MSVSDGRAGLLVWSLCILLVAGYLAHVCAEEPDSDLVFDNLEDTHSPHDAKSSQPVEEAHWLSSTFHRIRRNVGKFFNSFSSTEGRQKSRKHRQAQEGDEYNDLDDTYEEDDDIGYSSINSQNWNRNNYTGRSTDDEDLGGISGEGSADDDQTQPLPTHPPGQPAFYRITFILGEPFIEDFNNRQSRSFQEVSRSVSQEIERLYESFPGRQTAEVIKIERRSTDLFTSKITVDLGSINFYDEELLRNRILSHIQQTRRLGTHQVSPEEFNFRRFTGEQLPTCLPHEIPCHSGECVPATARCNGLQECRDSSDEAGCDTLTTVEGSGEPGPEDGLTKSSVDVPTAALPPVNRTDKCRADDKVRCADNSVYICSDQLCDGRPDCPDGDDEQDCPSDCAANEFMCDVVRCIPLSGRCNGVEDCSDGTDEHNCGQVTPTCLPDEFTCDNKCFNAIRICDGHQDCSDGSDEQNCPPKVAQCGAGEYSCEDGRTCFREHQRCDGIHDCPSGLDERGCPQSCRSDEFQCENDKRCISINFRCDEYNDCSDGSDESNCAKNCRPDEFFCMSENRCLPDSVICDGRRDCGDGSDEVDCPVRACAPQEFRCEDGSCIPSYLVCDGTPQCRDRSDELQCPCSDNEFQCLSGSCIPNYLRCNRLRDCNDGSDEQDCPTPTPPPVIESSPLPISCPFGQRPCRSTTQCVRNNQWCDGRADCYDLSDESGCGPQGGDGLNIRTYPDAQDIKESSEVVFQCRDEGPLRARVHWIRGNGLALPPGSRDVSGRLEMPNIRVEHSGAYICEALGYPPNTPGAQVTVQLRVDQYVPPPPPPRPPTACALHEATCSNGDCIPKNRVCDGRIDCTDGSDESRCNPHGCEPNEFRCANKRCILKTWRCDSDDDCGDGSDEANCATNPPGSPCAYHQFACLTNNQCIPKSFHCDQERDCLDGSDEVGCGKPVISKPPPPMVNLNVGELFVVTCIAVGIPTPEVVWRLNWGHIPEKCSYISENGEGTLTCPSIQIPDQGAYSCEAINIKGSVFAVPDTILVVNPPDSEVCPIGMFNEEARSASECIPCFCFGHTTECRSADLFIYHFQPPFDSFKYLGVAIDPRSGVVDIRDEPIYRGAQPQLRPLGRNGVQAELYAPRGELAQSNVVPYFAMPENYHGNQLKSYGGYLRYNVTYRGNGVPINAPNVIITGNGYTLLHIGENPRAGYEQHQSVRFFVGEWVKRSDSAPEILATREEIMMALAAVDNILIKLQYVNGHLDTSLSNIEMDSAATPNSGLGAANFVEECSCPVGYTGTSCENCAEGYSRHKSGPWLGQCYKEPEVCPPGTYGDPSRGIACEVCPCPLTNPSNQFARTCTLAPDGQVTCDCPPGYVGRRCEQCAIGYTGNPLVPGDSCRPGTCSPEGAVSVRGDSQGRCQCKQNTMGPSCNQCKPNTFYLSADNQFGCIACFCMGVTRQCKSSYWFRDQISTAFTSSRNDFKLVELQKKEEPIVDGIRLDLQAREIVYSDFLSRSQDVFYWSIPNRFLGDKITSYGGYLRYTLRYVPTPGGQSSRNTAPDVELVSANHISLLYFGREQPAPNQIQTFSVPLLEQYWQRADGQQADREHMLMALADLEAIYIKATYTTSTREAALISVSLDIADERNTGSSERALAVEQCDCPPGYKGLSCEDCDVGYTRGIGGIYLGVCEPCNCNGMSNECDVETGDCLNCRYPTAGAHCENCLFGFEGDPSNGIPCRYVGPSNQTCTCDDRGALSAFCDSRNRCPCKSNVEGDRCDRCRPGTFGLKASNFEGCHACFCSGVANECSESNLYREQIPVQVIDAETSGFSLVDRYQRERITNGFQTNIAMNEIGYTFRPSNPQQWYWSLPRVFTGYRVTSYGGRLEFTQRYTQRPQAAFVADQDVVIIGNGVTIFWTNPEALSPDIANKVSVELSPTANWQRLDFRQGPRPASREDILIALANIDAVLVRAQLSSDTVSTYISDITLDTAVNAQTGQSRATDVEVCRCPLGYRGTSCELCASGYYRDPKDTSKGPLGSCTKCPCNNNERSCELGPDNRITCHCLEGFSGSNCEIIGVNNTTEYPPPPIPPPRPNIQIQITPSPVIEIIEVGSTVRLTCSARSTSPRPVRITWRKEGGNLPFGAIDDGRGLLIISEVKVSDSGRYICQATDGTTVVTEQYILTVGGNARERPRVTINPNYLEISTYETIDIHCRSSGTPEPVLEFKRQDGQPLNPTHSFDNGRFFIPRALDTDAGVYECIASNEAGFDRATIDVRVTAVPDSQSQVDISPPSYSGVIGDTFTLSCRSSGGNSITQINWAKRGGDLPYSARSYNGQLTISDARIEDSGVYICSVVNHVGTVGQASATVIIEPGAGVFPTVKVSPERLVISQGSSVEIRCDATGTPAPIIKWTKYDGNLGPQAEQIGSILYIRNAQVSDRGLYICVATNEHGLAQSTTMVEVNRLEAPAVEIHPDTTQTITAGGSAILQCLITAGIPQPNVTWTGPGGRPLSANIEQLAGGSLRFTQISLSESGEFICTAENEAGKTTAVGTIIVQTRPEVTIVPNKELIAVRQGERLRIECIASGTPQPSVEWIKPGIYSYGEREEDLSISRAFVSPSAIVELAYASTTDAGTYTCRASNTAGVVEKRIQVVVDTLPSRGNWTRPGGEDAGAGQTSGEVDVPPGGGGYKDFEHPPPTTFERDLVTPVGTRAELRCRVSEENPQQRSQIIIDWIRADNSSLPYGAYVRNGVLYIDNAQPEASGQYRCYGVNSTTGRVLFSFGTNLTVIVPPSITLSPPRQVVRPGDHTFIHCSASGQEPITINWSGMGRTLPLTARVENGYLRFQGIQIADAGRYLCTAQNQAGQAEGVAEVFVQNSPARPTLPAESRDQSAPQGSDVTLRCRPGNGNYGQDVTWFREGQSLPVNSRIDGEYLHIFKVQPDNAGRYYCEVPTGQGVSTDFINLSVVDDVLECKPNEFSCGNGHCVPNSAQCNGFDDCGDNTDELNCFQRRRRGPTRQPQVVNSPDLYISASKELLRLGDTVDVTCQSSEPGVIASWSRPVGRMADNVYTSSGSLRIFNVRIENAGTYRCEATGYRGVYHKDYTLDIVDNSDDSKDQTPPDVQTEAQGSTVLIKCNTDLEGNVQYEWKKLDGNLPNHVNTRSQSIQLNDIKSNDAGTYVCTASNGQTSIDIPKILVVTGIVPYFAQAPSSYIALTTLPDAYIYFSFEISFRPERGDGLILYNGHKRNEPNNDFISLSLTNAVPVFRINLGSGVTVLRADRPVRLGKWHTVKVTRNRKKVTMYVDGEGPYTAMDSGRYVGLDLSEPLFVGGVPNFKDIAPEADAFKGFVGCISRFKIGQAHQDIINEATFKSGITTCETCTDNPCENQGVCQEALSKEGYTCICPLSHSGPNCNKLRGEACSPYTCGTGKCVDTENSFTCLCPLGKSGKRCEREISVEEPAFTKDAYIAYPTPKPQRRFKVSMKLKPRDVNGGVIMYVAESEEGHGDFTSLAIRNRRLEFRFDSGNGPTIVRSEKDLLPNHETVVSASKTLTEGKLIVNGNAPVIEKVVGSTKPLNLRTPLYVGGVDRQNIRVSRGVGVNDSYEGCISDINISGLDIKLIDSIEESANVEDCSAFSEEDNDIASIFEQRYTEDTSPSTPAAYDNRRTGCSSYPCLNQGLCYPLSPITYKCSCINGYTGINCEVAPNLCEQLIPCQNGGTCNGNTTQYECDCNLGYTGRNCEQRAEIRFEAEFAGRGYLEFSRALLPHNNDNEEETIALELSTNSSSGLIFFHGQTPNEDGQGQDYIYLAIVGGYLEYSYDMGTGPAIIHNGKVRINDGERHNVILKRRGQEGSIEVDHGHYVEGETLGFANKMNCAGNIYLGGVPNISLMTGAKFTQGFNGCIHGFELQDRRRIDLGAKAISGVNVKPCYRSEEDFNTLWRGDEIVN